MTTPEHCRQYHRASTARRIEEPRDMPRPSMIPTAQGKIINVILWAEREGYMHVAADLRAALALLPAEEIPPHPAPMEIREAVVDYIRREIEAEGYPLSRRTLMIRRGAPPHRCVIWENWEALDNIRKRCGNATGRLAAKPN